MNFQFSRIGKALGSKEMWKTIGWTLGGGVAGELLGAVIQGVSGKDGQGGYKLDMSGIKGDIVTGGVITAVALGFDKPAAAVGTLAVKGMKAFYLYGNPLLVKTVGSPIPPSTKMDYLELSSTLQTEPVNDAALPAGMELITAPDGTQKLVSSGTAGETMNDFSTVPLADKSSEPLRDYSTVPLADYTLSPFHATTSLNEDFESMLMRMAA